MSFDRSVSQVLQELATSQSFVGVGGEQRTAKRRSFLLEESGESNIDFAQRFASFGQLNWPLCSSTVSALTCARRGWMCVERELLQCVHCHNYVSGRLPAPYNVRAYNDALYELCANLVDAHASSCYWVSAEVPASECQPETADADQIKVDMLTRLERLRRLDLSQVNMAVNMVKTLSESQQKQLRQTLGLGDDESVPSSLLTIAALGWDTVEDDSVNIDRQLLHCAYCRRSVPLWLFTDEPRDGGAAAKRARIDSKIKRRFSTKNVDLGTYIKLKVKFASKHCHTNTQTDEKRVFDAQTQHECWCPWLEHVTPMCPTADATYETRWLHTVHRLIHTQQQTVTTTTTTAATSEQPTAVATMTGSLSMDNATSRFTIAEQLLRDTVSTVVQQLDATQNRHDAPIAPESFNGNNEQQLETLTTTAKQPASNENNVGDDTFTSQESQEL